ncbi:MAG: HD domain-containing protein [Anaerolineae bacterium]|jgi:hypothetical protein|nr:HD domain-containing protein [Anaerolineae bacterium]
MAVGYRLRQGIRALFAFARPMDYDLAARYLSVDELRLFRQMRRNEQWHSLNVLRSVLTQGDTPRELAVAALLHDVGKIRYPMAIWQKSLAVVIVKLFPRHAQRWSQADERVRWARPLIVKARHPQWSGELLLATHSHPLAIWLVTHHQDAADLWLEHPDFKLLQRLQAADNEN